MVDKNLTTTSRYHVFVLHGSNQMTLDVRGPGLIAKDAVQTKSALAMRTTPTAILLELHTLHLMAEGIHCDGKIVKSKLSTLQDNSNRPAHSFAKSCFVATLC